MCVFVYAYVTAYSIFLDNTSHKTQAHRKEIREKLREKSESMLCHTPNALSFAEAHGKRSRNSHTSFFITWLIRAAVIVQKYTFEEFVVCQWALHMIIYAS